MHPLWPLVEWGLNLIHRPMRGSPKANYNNNYVNHETDENTPKRCPFPFLTQEGSVSKPREQEPTERR